jgi:hypothetical protein
MIWSGRRPVSMRGILQQVLPELLSGFLRRTRKELPKGLVGTALGLRSGSGLKNLYPGCPASEAREAGGALLFERLLDALKIQIAQKKRTQTQNRRPGDLLETFVLGLLEMKGEGFFRRAPRQDQITWVCRSDLGSHVDADSNVGAIVLTVGDVCRGTDFQLAVYRGVLVNGEGHGAWLLLRILGNRGLGRDCESKRTLVDRGNLSRHGLRLWGSLLTLWSLMRVSRRQCQSSCYENRASQCGKTKSPYVLHYSNPSSEIWLSAEH